MYKPEKPGLLCVIFFVFIGTAVAIATQQLFKTGAILVASSTLFAVLLIVFLPKLRGFSQKHTLISVLIVVTAAVIPRIVFLYFVKTIPAGDFQTYNLLANGIAGGTLLTDSSIPVRYASVFPHTVAYPAFLSVFLRIYNNTAFWSELLSVVCFSASAVVVGMIAEQIQRGGFLSGGLLFGLFPSGIYYSALMTTESLFVLLMLISVSVFICFMRISLTEGWVVQKLLILLAFSVSLSLANAVRPLGYIILAASLIMLILHGFKGRHRRAVKVLMTIFIMLLLHASMTRFILNQTEALLNREIASSPSGFNLYVGMNAASRGQWNEGDSARFSEYAQNDGLEPQQIHDIFLGMGISRGLSHRSGVFGLLFSKLRVMWGSDSESVDYIKRAVDYKETRISVLKYEPLLKNTANIYYLSVLLTVLFWMIYGFITKSVSPIKLYPMLIILGMLALHSIVEAASRYHAPALPILCVLALPCRLQKSPYKTSKKTHFL